MAKGIKKRLRQISNRVGREISANASQGFFAAGMAREGYLGGYWDALQDVLLALNGVAPNRRQFWDDEYWKEAEKSEGN